ncbi:MotA/TolQ/ExbB proton channel family protein [Desulfoluna spongiiphila]|uniref:MotA/TolQ/ExbB proton channel family protein n=1 Tax=Desulfoluna spongiiphila TaxID=419481 RepID=A0A1G5IFM2_9BACT|nr:MotA/TolQ/ExbB proton channel family protein [Desulfoluna spongiiphila]SCY74490.1 MotA/TolQ/ExbB proton channel family protein [Desulfoluna spongiiphila]
MEFIVHIFKLYPSLISDLVQGVVYIGSALLFLNAVWLIALAYRHARLIKTKELMRLAPEPATLDDPLMTAAVKTLHAAHDEHKGTPYPVSFLIDATHQMMVNIYHTRYINKITMITNLLPPMGFIGTIFGMIMIFLAKADPNSDLNTTGLGVALFTTLIALTCFVILEVFKKNLINLATSRIERALGHHQSICEMTAQVEEEPPLPADSVTTP